jgi:hypothetical protein
MKLNPVRLKLPTEITQSAVTEGDRLYIGQKIDAELFQAVYKDQIAEPTLSPEKAIYVALHSSQKLPSVHDLLLRVLRG